jgi:decaprenyl-phosphate phosphoribosyltransferase
VVGQRTSRRPAAALLAAARPRQWPKNLLVLAAPAAAAALSRPVAGARATAAVVFFCAAASGVYLLNDTIDARADRLHPVKRYRPVAAGELDPRLAAAAGCFLLVAAVAASALVAGAALAWVVAAYVAVSLCYSLVLKRVPVLEMLCVSSGFLLRAVAGGAAAHVPLSPWFLVVACSGALFVVLGKRAAELHDLEAAGAAHRAALGWYRASWLRGARRLAAVVAAGAYVLWAFGRAAGNDDHSQDGLFFLLSAIPFVLALVAVDRAVETGRGGAPEELALRDRGLQLLGLSSCALLALGVYT